MGIKTVAVYSEADRDALHVDMADEAVAIGPPPAAQSYLVIDKIVEACRKTGAEAVHPGYGFLSERAAFADGAGRAPASSSSARTRTPSPPWATRSRSKKAAAAAERLDRARPSRRDRRRQAGGADRRRDRLSGDDQGFGRRRRQGHARRPFRRRRSRRASRRARSEAKSRFGDDRVFIEKFIDDPRHIEIQVLGDKHGNVIHLGERECSIQRRNQKVDRGGALAAARRRDPRKAWASRPSRWPRRSATIRAGTVEFVAGQDRSFFFLEMNTRLQVEHPVTELVTGIDLVEQMIRVAAGEKLGADAGRRGADRLGRREPHLCRGSLSQFPALDRPADALPAAAPRARDGGNGPQRYRRVRRRRDLDLLRSDDRQARAPTRPTARGGDRRAWPMRSIGFVIDGIRHNIPFLAALMQQSALALGRAVDRLHRRGVPGRLRGAGRRSGAARHARLGGGGARSHRESAQAPDHRSDGRPAGAFCHLPRRRAGGSEWLPVDIIGEGDG